MDSLPESGDTNCSCWSSHSFQISESADVDIEQSCHINACELHANLRSDFSFDSFAHAGPIVEAVLNPNADVSKFGLNQNVSL